MPRIDSENATRFWFDQRTPGLSLLSADFTTHEYPTQIHEAILVAVTEVGGQRSRPAVFLTRRTLKHSWL